MACMAGPYWAVAAEVLAASAITPPNNHRACFLAHKLVFCFFFFCFSFTCFLPQDFHCFCFLQAKSAVSRARQVNAELCQVEKSQRSGSPALKSPRKPHLVGTPSVGHSLSVEHSLLVKTASVSWPSAVLFVVSNMENFCVQTWNPADHVCEHQCYLKWGKCLFSLQQLDSEFNRNQACG